VDDRIKHTHARGLLVAHAAHNWKQSPIACMGATRPRSTIRSCSWTAPARAHPHSFPCPDSAKGHATADGKGPRTFLFRGAPHPYAAAFYLSPPRPIMTRRLLKPGHLSHELAELSYSPGRRMSPFPPFCCVARV